MRQIKSVRVDSVFNGELHYTGSEEDDFGTIEIEA
jgi:hypothetical protein